MQHQLKLNLGRDEEGGGWIINRMTCVYQANLKGSLNGTFSVIWDPTQNASKIPG